MPAFAFGVPVDLNAFHYSTNCSGIPFGHQVLQYHYQFAG
jgi:hypothetical protein